VSDRSSDRGFAVRGGSGFAAAAAAAAAAHACVEEQAGDRPLNEGPGADVILLPLCVVWLCVVCRSEMIGKFIHGLLQQS
jgi:hypothetical protein